MVLIKPGASAALVKAEHAKSTRNSVVIAIISFFAGVVVCYNFESRDDVEVESANPSAETAVEAPQE